MRYIEQLKPLHISLWKFLPLPLLLGYTFFINWFFLKTNEIDTNDVIAKSIEEHGRNANFVIMILPMVCMLFALLFWVALVQRQTIRSLITGRDKIDWKRIGFSFGIWTLVLIGSFIISYFLNPQDYQWNFELKKFFPFMILALVLIPLQTSFEELMFRGHMMQGIGLLSKRRSIALIFTSVFFGLMHLANPEVGKIGYFIMIYYIGTGFFLGLISLLDDGLELALGFHAANNLIGALLVTSNWSAFQTDSIFLEVGPPENSLTLVSVLVQVGVILPFLILLFSKVYRWNNWREKIFGKIV